MEEKIERKVGKRKNMRKISMVLTRLRRFVAATYVSPPHVAATCRLVRTVLKSMKSDRMSLRNETGPENGPN